ncbi:MAG: hypothetical protein E6X17_10330 [Sporomusaceae bacterium]|nr:hypothetical protein [Sporomusaceae bacterium]
MKRLVPGLLLLLLLFSAPACEAADILFTVNANDNADQVLHFAGYDFLFQHMEHRTYLYREKNVNNGFQWTAPVISCWLKKTAEPDSAYSLWQQFFFEGAVVPLEAGQVFTRYTDGRNVQMLIEKVAYYTGYRADVKTAGWTEATLPKYITVRIIVH